MTLVQLEMGVGRRQPGIKLRRHTGSRGEETPSLRCLPRGAAGVGTLTCVEKSPRDSLPKWAVGCKVGFCGGRD